MKVRTLVMALLGLLTVVGIGAILFILGTDRKAQAQAPTQTPDSNQVAWQRQKIPISSTDSKLTLNIPDLATKSEYIIGVKPIDPGEQEHIVAGVVSWVNSGISNERLIPKIGSVTNYPSDLISGSAGTVNISNSANLFSEDQSLVIYAKVAAGTVVTVRKANDTLVDRSVEDGFVIQQGLPAAMKNIGPAGLLVQLQTGRLARAFGQGSR